MRQQQIKLSFSSSPFYPFSGWFGTRQFAMRAQHANHAIVQFSGVVSCQLLVDQSVRLLLQRLHQVGKDGFIHQQTLDRYRFFLLFSIRFFALGRFGRVLAFGQTERTQLQFE